MPTFDGSLRIPGEPGPGLHVVIDLNDETIRLRAAAGELGSWPRTQVRLNALPDGFHLRAEGEEVILDVDDDAEFAVAYGLTNAPPILRRKMSSILRDRPAGVSQLPEEYQA
jgi:hypothetical protein